MTMEKAEGENGEGERRGREGGRNIAFFSGLFRRGQNNSTRTMSKSNFAQLGLNKADTLKSNSILIYSHQEQSIYTRGEWHDAMVMEMWN
jgi:hypothetical protein